MADTNKITYVSLGKLGYYDTKLKAWVQAEDAALKTELQKNIDAANTAISNEETRAKAAELANAAAADAAQKDVDALEALVGTPVEGKTVVGMIEDVIADAYNDTEVRNLIAGLQSSKADKTQVATDIADAVKAEEDARKEAVQGVQNAVDTLSGTHATDKKALEDAIALKADQTALDGVSAVANAAVKQSDYNTKVKALEDEDARIVGLVEAEAGRAAGVEAGLDERLVEVETFFKTAEDETLDAALDTLVELQKYLESEGAIADQMLLDIADNKKAIEDHEALDHDFAAADATLKSELEGKIALKADKTTVEGIDGRVEVLEGEMDAVEGKVSTLEGEMDGVQAAVATKAEAQALADAVSALQGVDAGQETRIAALEGKFGGAEGSIEDQIADAKQEAIDAAAQDATTKANKALEDAKKYADDEDAKIESRVDALETASAKHALASDLTALEGRVTTAEGEIDALQTLAAANKAAHEANAAAIALKADKSALEAEVTRATAKENAIEAKIDAFEECTVNDIDALFA